MGSGQEHALDLAQRDHLDIHPASGRRPGALSFRNHQPVGSLWVPTPERGEVGRVEGSLGPLVLNGDGMPASPQQDEIDLVVGFVAPVVNGERRAVSMNFIEEEVFGFPSRQGVPETRGCAERRGAGGKNSCLGEMIGGDLQDLGGVRESMDFVEDDARAPVRSRYWASVVLPTRRTPLSQTMQS